MRAHLVAALAAGALFATAGTAGTANAGAPPQSATAHKKSPNSMVGGPLLASKGVIESPLPGAPPLPPASSLPASSWMITDLTTGQVLAAKDPHGRFLPASTLKTLTAVTLLPKLKATSTFDATVKDETVDGTRVGLVAGMKYTVGELFTCMLVDSANDAADALAQDNGGIAKTVAQMNAEAHTLQADDTLARTPSGLDGVGETTSAYDLALIAKAGLAMPDFRHYVSTIRARVPAPHHKHYMIYTHNPLLTTYRGDIGVKNGYTVAAQATYVGAATRHGQTMLVTLMHAYPIFSPMAAALLNWAFQADGKVTPVGNLVSPLVPKPPATISAAQHVSAPKPAALVAGAGGGLGLGSAFEIAAAAVVALCAAGVVIQRRRVRNRRRQRRYTSRLRVP
jgi:serine-type D-Ala-D-Ala carboxypeptidase (penicillin-binding protein 5/6)